MDLIERLRADAGLICNNGITRKLPRQRVAALLHEAADEIESLRSEVERANSWNERVSVCRDHVADIVDGICVICTLDAIEDHADRMWAEADRLAKEMVRIQQKYDERTAYVIVHRGSALACSDAVRSAYLDEHRRAERLAEALRDVAQALSWRAHGECRGFSERLLAPNEALDMARALLRDQEEGNG